MGLLYFLGTCDLQLLWLRLGPESGAGPVSEADGGGRLHRRCLVSGGLHAGRLTMPIVDDDAGRAGPPGPGPGHLAHLLVV
jgi:hypothetical protein